MQCFITAGECNFMDLFLFHLLGCNYSPFVCMVSNVKFTDAHFSNDGTMVLTRNLNDSFDPFHFFLLALELQC